MRFNLSDYLEATDTPLWITHNSAWIYHIPMAAVLIKMLQPRVFVELGTFRGDSYMAFCQAVAKCNTATHCTAVDNWNGDAHAGFYGPNVLKELALTHDPLYGTFSTLLKSDFMDARRQFANGSIDLLHIDGHHTYSAVKADFEAWQPKLSDRAVVLFHDTAVRERDFGVWKLWEELSTSYRGFNVPYGCGLGILAVGKNLPEPFEEFMDELNHDSTPILTQLQTLGMRIEQMRTIMSLVNDLHHEQSVLNEWRKIARQTILQPTPNVKAAWDEPRKYSMTVVGEVRELLVDTLKLVQENHALREKATARIGVVKEVVDAAREKTPVA